MISQIVVFVSIFTITATAPVLTNSQNNRLSNSIGKPTPVPTSASTSASSSSTSSSKERNWLLTKAWLIDNINRLRHEFNELERDYSHHIESDNALNANKDKQLVEDMATIRADHTVLSQQQKQIIQLIKNSQMHTIGAQTHKQLKPTTIETTPAMNDNYNYDNNVLLKKRHKKRHSNFGDLVQKEQSFEDQTKRNMSEVFAQMSALHDITINIFEDLIDLEKKVNEKFEH